MPNPTKQQPTETVRLKYKEEKNTANVHKTNTHLLNTSKIFGYRYVRVFAHRKRYMKVSFVLAQWKHERDSYVKIKSRMHEDDIQPASQMHECNSFGIAFVALNCSSPRLILFIWKPKSLLIICPILLMMERICFLILKRAQLSTCVVRDFGIVKDCPYFLFCGTPSPPCTNGNHQ